MASSIAAIYTFTENSEIVALATSEVLGQASLLVLDDKTGSPTRATIDVPLPASLAAGLQMDQLRSALLVTHAQDIFVALADADGTSTRVSIHSYRGGLESETLHDFVLSDSDSTSAAFQPEGP